MKIRRYIAANTQEAILKVKMDLGNEALILNTRKVYKKGILRFFAKPMFEVLAAIDEDYEAKKNQAAKNAAEEKNQQVIAYNTSRLERNETAADGRKEVNINKNEKMSELETKVNSMESILQKIYQHVQPAIEKDAEQDVSLENQQVLSKVLQIFSNNLLKNEVDADIVKQITDMVKEKLGENISVSDTASVLYNIISGIFGKPETIKLREDGKPTVAIFVGPTGVGKTTTLAKIAANFALNQKKSVAFITADTYRIAAVEQIKTYADILGIEVSVVYTPNEIIPAIDSFSDKDIILIDTAGRSHKNLSQFEELKKMVDAAQADEVYLVLSATASLSTCKEILKNYSFLKDFRIIFTKLDEASVPGIIFNAKYLTRKSISYITTGQSVPDDIEVVNIDKITKILLGSINQ